MSQKQKSLRSAFYCGTILGVFSILADIPGFTMGFFYTASISALIWAVKALLTMYVVGHMLLAYKLQHGFLPFSRGFGMVAFVSIVAVVYPTLVSAIFTLPHARTENFVLLLSMAESVAYDISCTIFFGSIVLWLMKEEPDDTQSV